MDGKILDHYRQFSLFINPGHLGHRYQLMRQYDRAIEQYSHALDLDPQWHYAYEFLAQVCALKGEFDKTIQVAETGMQIPGQRTMDIGCYGVVFALAGRRDKAQNFIEELKERSQKEYVPASALVIVYAGLREIEECLNWMEISVDEQCGMMPTIRIDRLFDPMRSHPRYKALLKKMNLEPDQIPAEPSSSRSL